MQKDEEDILVQWIEYHSYLCGYENIYIIDNHSGQKTKDILNVYGKKGCHISTESDYSKKGDYICDLINKNPCDFAIPLDLDEFIAINTLYAEENNRNENENENENSLSVSTSKELIYNELHRLMNIKYKNSKDAWRYSFSCYLTSINDKLYYTNPLIEITSFTQIDNANGNKKFFCGHNNYLFGLDHGNHSGTVKNHTVNEFINSKLILFHFHYRGVLKLIQKCRNDITGLGYSLQIPTLQRLLKQKVLGSHNIETYLKYYQYGTYSLIDNETKYRNGVEVTALSNFFRFI